MAKAAYYEQEELAMKEELTKEKHGRGLKKNETQYNSLTALNKRSMVLDEENFEENFLKCNVCKERFSEPNKTPKILNCHHSFCIECILKLFRTEAEYRQSLTPSLRGMPTAVTIHCPSCRHSFITTEENLKQLPTDHRIVQLMDFVKNTERYTVTFCSKHNMQPLNFFCEPCIKPVCRDCTVIDHKETTGHLVMDLDQAMKKYTPLLDKALGEIEFESKALDEKRVALETAIIKLDRTKIDILQSIHKTFDNVRVRLCERERELRDIAESELSKEKVKLTEKIQLLKARNKTIQAQTEKLKQSKLETNIEEMFRTHQDIRESRAATTATKMREFDDRMITSFMFNASEEPMLLSKLSNFGDINSKMEEDTTRPRSLLNSRKPRR